MSNDNRFNTPVGRLVQGSLYVAQTKNMAGTPYADKNGQPISKYFFAIAVAKGAEAHWNQTPWGAHIWNYVHTQMANKVPAVFKWKIEDGDSTVLNQNDKRNCDREGFPRNWVIKLSSFFAPSLYRIQNGAAIPLIEENAINPGDFIQVRVNLGIHQGPQNPTVFLNPEMVCFNSYGPRIITQNIEDANEVGFDAAPVGSTTPLASAGFAAPVTAQSAPPQAVAQQTVYVPPVTPTTPHPDILAPQTQAPAVRPKIMTPKANGIPYEQWINSGQGWTDELLIRDGYMMP